MSIKKTIKVLIADDDPLVRAAVATLLTLEKDMTLVGEAINGEEAIRKAQEFAPDILVLDQNMPNATGIETLRQLATSATPVKTILLTVFMENRHVVEALQLGARGLVLKESAQPMLVRAIRAVEDGQFWFGDKALVSTQEVVRDLTAQLPKAAANVPELSEKERRITQMIVEGCTNKEIAGDLQTSEQMIKNYLGRIFDKLGVWNRLELAMYAIDHGLVQRS